MSGNETGFSDCRPMTAVVGAEVSDLTGAAPRLQPIANSNAQCKMQNAQRACTRRVTLCIVHSAFCISTSLTCLCLV